MSDKITSVVARESDGNIQITFTIPFPVVKSAEEETVKEFSKDMVIPGFRKGMAPIEKVREKIPQSDLIEHSLSHILPKALSESITENKLIIAVYPKFELISSKEGENWQVRGITCELPEVNLGDYKKVVQGAMRSANLWTPDKGKPDEKKEPTREEKEGIVIKSLLDYLKIKVPSILIEEEANSRLSSLLERLEKLGLALESYLTSIGKTAEDLRASYAKQASEAISLDLILTAIAEGEGIKVDNKEVDSALNMSQATQSKKESETDLARRRKFIESMIKRRAALDFLINLT